MSKNKSGALIWLDVEVKRVTEMAALVFDGKVQAWIPLSQVQDLEGDGEDRVTEATTRIEVPEWLAFEKGFI